MADEPTCRFCGEPEHSSSCRQELSLLLADQKADSLADHQHLAALQLEVASLRWDLQRANLNRFHP